MNSWIKIVVGLLLFTGLSCVSTKKASIPPESTKEITQLPDVVRHSDTLITAGANFLIKNHEGLWELYVEGSPYERGQIIGALTQPLYHQQEAIFFNKIKDIIPSENKQKLLRFFLKFYNRKLHEHISDEYKAEIYGLSQYGSSAHDYVAPNYLRSMYLHGAHDIGHALQDLMLVGCSSMAVWGDKTVDGDLLIGRNFDFYAGDEFAKNKIVAFIRPDQGIPFMMVTWGGMIGAVSGMNYEGLTVTINAGKSKIPLKAKTPISILAREILQYATTIDEALAIAKKREVFVSESILVGSAKDKKAVLIEVSPKNFGVYQVENSNQLICTNHFQSEAYKEDKKNNKHKAESHSQYRYLRIQELLNETQKLNEEDIVAILREKEGLADKKIGYGNEKALNQLLAHHGIVFSPEKKKVWVSSSPYQLGTFVAYDLNAIFGSPKIPRLLNASNELIVADSFKDTKEYFDYEQYRILDRVVDDRLEEGDLSEEFITNYQSLNPDLWIVYYKIGKYYFERGHYEKAQNQFLKAQEKEITTLPDKEAITSYLKKVTKKIDK
ncbi:MAG: acyl-CoA--6-aminopenicillanic acid acyl-transferase [Flavobacteriales bacterium]|nr:acyl-CoA--6-aminopenicillanic acid acyl-transferase [Flavobacteriales bacterium]